MITLIRLLRNVGQFDSVHAGANIPLARLALVYAENGRGKTTLAAVLRSLASGDAIPIAERKRLAAAHPPHVVIECAGGPPFATFENNAWNRTLSDLLVFDDHFIDANVYSGLVVTSDHRQNLHELILGAQGVSLTRRLQELAERIERHNGEIRTKAAAIPAAERGTLTVDQFCDLPARDDIDEAIKTADRNLAAIRQQESIRNTTLLPEMRLPSIDLVALEALMAEGLPALDAAALARLQQHFSLIGEGGEAWVSAGIPRISTTDDGVSPCPFCCQSLNHSPILEHYRAFFSEEYRLLKERIATVSGEVSHNHGGDSQAGFERSARTLTERRQFWSQFVDMPTFDIDLLAVARVWRTAREGILTALQSKQRTPLEQIALSVQAREAIEDYQRMRLELEGANQRFQATAEAINLVKEQAEAGDAASVAADLARLQATKARHTPDISAKCTEYLAAKTSKAATEREREQAQADLDQYRTSVFPGFQTTINLYLERFNAGFRLDSVTSTLTRGGPTCTYNVIVNDTPVPVSGARDTPGQPSFRTTLSAGDRNTLALAFFFASLDHDPNIGQKTVAIDDPISSLDEHRALTTVQELRRLVARVAQVIVLSHSKPFLCRIWENANRNARSAMTVARDTNGSTLRLWNVGDDCITEHDRRHALLRSYHANGGGDSRDVAQAIRPILEAFSRVAYPEHFLPGAMLGQFRETCSQRVGTPQEILSQTDIDELRDLIEYANRFHHDTNQAWQTEVINDGELHGYVRRALTFAKR